MINILDTGMKIRTKHFITTSCIISKDTPFKVVEIEITKVIMPKEPFNIYSEPRYNYKHTNEDITGNIGENLLITYLKEIIS